MSETDYGVSAPEELKAGDRVKVVGTNNEFEGETGEIKTISVRSVGVNLDSGKGFFGFNRCYIRRFPDTISFKERFGISQSAVANADKIVSRTERDSDNVKAFKTILNEMAETYRAKDATYGNAYQDGFNRFGAVQLVSRMYEKYCRIENLLVRNADNKVPDESVADTLTDLAVQAICLRMLLQDNDFENVD